MHAELLSGRVPGATLAAVYDASPERRRGDRGAARRPGRARAPRSCSSSPRSTRSRSARAPTRTSTRSSRPPRPGKPIFCEKPRRRTSSPRSTGRSPRSSGPGVLFQVGFNRRFDPAHQSVREAVASGAIGDVHLVRISSRDPAPPPLEYARSSGGLFLDMTIHDFDMARYVTGSEVVEVFARGAVRITPELAEFGDIDTAVVTLVHENGALDRDRQQPPGRLRLRPARGGLRLARAWPRPRTRSRTRASSGPSTGRTRRRCRTSSSSATCPATWRSGTRS